MKKEFSKFFIASLKRTAQNVSPLVRRKQKLNAEIAEREQELKSIQVQLDAYEAPIKEVTGGFGTEDLVVRTVEVTDKMDKDGNPVKITKWNLRYPETIVPVVEPEATGSEENEEADEGYSAGNPDSPIVPPTTEGKPGSDFDSDKENFNTPNQI